MLSIFSAQNITVEFLWKFILALSLSKEDAGKFFNKFTIFILCVRKLDLYINDYINHLKDEVKQLTTMIRCGEKQIMTKISSMPVLFNMLLFNIKIIVYF